MSAALRHLIRRTTRAAQAAGQHVVSAAASAHHRLLVRLFAAIDTGATVRIAYTDEAGAATIRDIQPHNLHPTQKGHIVVTAWDLLRGDRRDFRTDRIITAA